MIKFSELSMKNFLSYGAVPTVVNLDSTGTTLILGEDLDNTASGVGANGVGKFLHVDCLVKTPNGWIRNGDIKVGQQLQMPDGSIAPVTGVFPQGKQPLYKVTFADGRSTLAGELHLWTVFSHRWGRQGARGTRTTTTEKLIQYLKESEERNFKPWYNIFVPTVTHPNIPDADLPIDPYLLGVLLGDGCISSGTGMITSADKSIISQCQQILNEQHNQHLVREEYECSSGYDWYIRNLPNDNNTIRSQLQQLNLYGCVSNTKFIPQAYLEGTSKQQKLDLLAGLLDTDGTVGKTKNVSFCSVSEQLAKDVQYLIRSLGGKATITTRTPFYTNGAGERVEGQLAYNVSIRYPAPRELFRLARKQDMLSQSETQYANEGLRIDSIERAEDGEALCIMVDHPEHLYITDDFIVTHNTTIINALTYALYDKPISNISKDNLINNINKRDMNVTLDFTIDKKAYHISRARKASSSHPFGAGNWVRLFEDGRDITPDSIANANSLIERIIGIPFDLFIRIVAIPASHTPFFDLPVRSATQANQTDMIEELFDLKTLSEKAVSLKDEIKDAEGSLKIHQVRVDGLEKEYVRHEAQVMSAKKRVAAWEVSNKNEIADIKRKLSKIVGVDIGDQQAKIAERRNQIKIRDGYRADLDMEKKLVAALDKDDVVEDKKIVHFKDDNCYACHQSIKDAKVQIAKSEDRKRVNARERKDSKGRTQLLELAYQSAVDQIAALDQAITVDNLDELIDISNKRASLETELENKRKANNPFAAPLQELLDIELDPIDMKKINELTSLIDHQKFLLKLLTQKDSFVRKALLNKNIPFLNQRLAHYLKEIGLQHTVEFTHEMTANITQFGRPLDFGNLSNGQHARINIALSFAFRDVLQSSHKQINVCMLDEVLDWGLDAVGVQAAAKMLKRKAREDNISLYIISHRDEIDSAFDNKMHVTMSKGFSYIAEGGD